MLPDPNIFCPHHVEFEYPKRMNRSSIKQTSHMVKYVNVNSSSLNLTQVFLTLFVRY